VAAPLKAVDRLLRSAPLTRDRDALYGAMGHGLLRTSQPLIVVDWSDLKADGRFKLLRAGLVTRGRTLTAYWLGRTHALHTRLIVHAATAQGRHAKTTKGQRRRDTTSEDAARSAKEP
jgi:hypothetical protein